MPRRMTRAFAPRKTRSYDWEGQTTFSLAMAAGDITDAVLFTGDRAETIQRVRGDILVWLDGASSVATDSVIVGMGLIVIPRTLTSAGVSPITEPGGNWLYHKYIVLATEVAVTTARSLGSYARVEIDNKSMRRFREDEIVVFTVETQNISGSPQVNVVAGIRILAGH